MLTGDGAVERCAVELSREMLRDAAMIFSADKAQLEVRKQACSEALLYGDRRFIADYLYLARVDERIILPASALDADPWVVGAQNLIIDLRTGISRRYSRKDFVTRTLGCKLHIGATCPRWDQFMKEVFPDPDLRHYVHKAVGYSLTGSMREQCFFFLHGSGHNGKSKFIETIEVVMGELVARAGKGISKCHEMGRLSIARNGGYSRRSARPCQRNRRR